MSGISGRPGPSEHAPYYGKYIALVEGHDAVAALELSSKESKSLLGSIGEERSHHRYAEGKWSLREVLLHVSDAERVFVYRALRIARGDATPLEGFDPDEWIGRAGAAARPWPNIIEEAASVRAASMTLFHSLPAEAWLRTGTADGSPISVRALAFIIAGHDAHHRRVVAEKYL